MIFDRTLLLSHYQLITASARSTDVIDLGATGTVFGAASGLVRDVGKGEPVAFLVQVVQDFNNLTSLTVTLQVDDNEGFTSPRDVQSATLPLADLKAGKTSTIVQLPPGVNERYVSLYYTVTGTAPSIGRISAGVVAAVQTAGVIY